METPQRDLQTHGGHPRPDHVPHLQSQPSRVDEPIFLPELEEGALRAGWRYDEVDGWMCPECLGGL